MTESTAPPVVIALGDENRSDDGFGFRVLERLLERPPSGARLVACRGDSVALLDLWADAELAVIVDAVRSGALPGTVRRIDLDHDPVLAARGPASTHGLSLAEAWALGAELGRRPRRCIAFGAEAASFAPGRTLTPAVARAVDEVAQRVRRELGPPADRRPSARRSREARDA